MKSNRWSVYKTKSRRVDSTDCHPKTSTAGKETLEITFKGMARVKKKERSGGVLRGEEIGTVGAPKGFDTRLELLNQIIPGWITELKFHSVRRWRFDYAHESLMIAVEVEGGVFSRGRHTRGAGYLADCEKYNQAQLLGYRVMRYAPKQMVEMVEDIKKMVEGQANA